MNKIAIIHFQPVEKYPPVMNVINGIYKVNNVICNIYTTNNKNNNWFATDKINIKRVATQHQNSLLRYWCYIQFNVVTFFSLMIKQPKVIVAFETYSVLPIYLYKKIFSKTITFIHYHEYVSLPEINSSSVYTKFLHSIEKKLCVVCDYISQTNNERLQLYLKDYPFINPSKTIVIPNFPPSNWYEFAKLNKKENKTGVTKLVHVGAISLNTMHTKKIVDWVVAQNGKCQIDFYSNNFTKDTKELFDNLNNENVRLLSNKNYFDLPQVLVNYDFGLTIYNGYILNHIYSVPNKVLEYLACGLKVCYSSELISTENFVIENNISGCQKIDFNTINTFDIKNISLDFFNENNTFKHIITQQNQIVSKISSFQKDTTCPEK